MDIMKDIMDFAASPVAAAILGGLWVISEALASIPSIKANSVFQLIRIVLERLTPEGAKRGALKNEP